LEEEKEATVRGLWANPTSKSVYLNNNTNLFLRYQGETIAVKKVKEERETDIRHLRKLNHPNIVQFRWETIPKLYSSDWKLFRCSGGNYSSIVQFR
jgi:hypothetical protein